MGSSSDSAVKNVPKNQNQPDVDELIKNGRKETFRPIKTFEETDRDKFNNNNNQVPYPNLDDVNIPKNKPPNKDMNKIKSAPLQYTDTNLVLTNYFENINDKDKEELDRINYKYTHSFYNFKTNPTLNDQSNLMNVIDKVNSDFGLSQSIQNDFNKMKTCLLYCSNLTADDERFINRLEYYDFIGNNFSNKQSIVNIIAKNKKQIPELLSNL